MEDNEQKGTSRQISRSSAILRKIRGRSGWRSSNSSETDSATYIDPNSITPPLDPHSTDENTMPKTFAMSETDAIYQNFSDDAPQNFACDEDNEKQDFEDGDEDERDYITIIDHSNPQAAEIMKMMRKSLRKMKKSSEVINKKVRNSISELSISGHEPKDDTDGFRYSTDSGVYDNIGDYLPPRRKERLVGQSRPELSCKHERGSMKLHCKTCKRIVCDVCMQAAHFGHNIEDMNVAVKRLSKNVEVYMSKLNSANRIFEGNIETVIAAENHMEKGYIDMETIVRSTANAMINKIQEDRDKLLDEIATHRSAKMSQTQSIKMSLNSILQRLTDQFSESYEAYQDSVQKGDSELVDVIQNVINPDENCQVIWAKQLALKNPIIKDHTVKITIADVVSKIHDVSLPSCIGSLQFDELLPIPIHYPSNLRLHTSSLNLLRSDIKMHKFQLGERFLLPGNIKCSRIFMVRGNFWFPQKEENCIDVYSPQGQKVTSIELPLIKGPNSILQSEPNEVLVGYSDRDSGGLTALHIPLHGDLIVKSTTNVFFGMVTDMSMEGNTLAVLSDTEGVVSVIEVDRETNIWGTTAAFNVPHKSKASMDTLLVNNSLIYICSWEDDMVSVFSKTGLPVNKFSFWSKLSTIGRRLNFCKFRMNMIDSQGSILLADKANDNFQILTPNHDGIEAKWQSFKLNHVSNPLDIVVIGDNEFWIIQGDEFYYLKQFIRINP